MVLVLDPPPTRLAITMPPTMSTIVMRFEMTNDFDRTWLVTSRSATSQVADQPDRAGLGLPPLVGLPVG